MDDKTFLFIVTASNALKKIKHGESIDFKCPLCNETAQASKSAYNGHIRAVCNGCGLRIIE